MKKLVFVSIFAASIATLAPATRAQQQSPLYIDAKIGAMDADFAGFDRAVNLGIGVGYDLNSTANGMFSIEGEFTTTASDGEITGGGEWDADTIAVYGAYRTAGNAYIKAKAGFLDQDIKREAGSIIGAPISGDDSGFAFGVGAGLRVNNSSRFEVEYTAASDEINFISVGYITHF